MKKLFRYLSVLLAPIVLLSMSIEAKAEDFMCTQEEGCFARVLYRDGTVEIRKFRRRDIVRTEGGYDVLNFPGWVRMEVTPKVARQGPSRGFFHTPLMD